MMRCEAMQSLIVLLQERAKFSEAEPLHRRALEINRRIVGEEHPGTL
jgi:hypothetical protein